ncbi:MAG: carboxypeptidase-like regulatory domain-containing protein, partial [Planctomycetota bacterium]
GRAGHGAPTRPDDPGRDVQAALGSGLHPATRAPRATRALAATDDAPPSAAGEGQTSALSGRVTDTSGDPLAGAEVFATSGPDYRVLAVTDAAGRYTAVLPDEAQWLGCTASGHGGAPGRHRLDPALGGDRPVDFVLTPSAAVPVRGRVVDACGLPIEGATVRLVPHRPLQDVLSRWQPLERGLVLRPAVTDARGEFMLERGGMRAHVLHVEHPSYSPLRVGASSALREAREIALLPRARVEGLLRRPDGSPAAGATVRVVGPDGWPRKVAAGPDGAFACDAPAGTVSVRASLPESDATWIAAGEVDLAEAGRARWDAELRPDGAVPGTLRSSAGEPLAGWRVVALADGPARSASLRLLAPNQADAVATTGADGRFLIGPLFAADGALFFEDPEGRFPAVRATYRRAGKSLDVVADERAAELTGSLAPELLADGPVELWAHSHAWLQPRRVELGSSGSFRVRGLPAGRCELVLWQAGLCPRSAGSWYLAPGELLSLPPLPGARPATLRVRVQAPALFPDWGVVVMAFRPRGGGRGDRLARVRADDAGRAEIPALAGEPLRLEIGGIRRARLIHHVQPEELARGEELALSFPPMQRYTLLVELPPTPVATDSWRLRVLDEAGNERLMQERPYRRIPRRKHLLTVALPDGVYDVVCELGTRTATFDDVEFVGGSPETVELALRDEDVR